MITDEAKTIGAKLNVARRRRGLTLSEIASLTGMSAPAICKTLKGQTCAVKTVRRIAGVLGVSMDELIVEPNT